MSKHVGGWWVYAIFPVDSGWDKLTKTRIEELPQVVRDAARELGWEGDVRGDNCAQFFIPGDADFRVGYVWKQDNNGSCFVASPVELPYLDTAEHSWEPS